MKILDTLRYILQYYGVNRGAGHTNAMLDGAMSTPSAIVITATHKQSMDFRWQGVPNTCVSLSEITHRLMGTRSPIVFDNRAMMVLLGDATKEIERLQNRVDELEEREVDLLLNLQQQIQA